MTDARDQILARIRAARSAVASAPGGSGAQAPGPVGPEAAVAAADAAYAALPRDYLRAHHDPARDDITALFAERAADYRAVVEQVAPDDVAAAVARALPAGTIVVPDGFPALWRPAPGPADPYRHTGDDPPLSSAALDRTAGVITGCAVAIAETGTIVLDHGPAQGRRALTLVPDFHLVVVRADQIAADLPDALARLDPARPLTFISGPSATSDIELVRVEGVHGPRNLHVLITSGE